MAFRGVGTAERRTSLPHPWWSAPGTPAAAFVLTMRDSERIWPRGILPFVLASLDHGTAVLGAGMTNAPGSHGEPRAFLVL
ncbi:hypothetical protein GCM10025877_02030 [Agromyces mangrovi Wang et al. 2018]|nr:hypothetical protein GCM10025877_02030 [Agromyces mangrovi]